MKKIIMCLAALAIVGVPGLVRAGGAHHEGYVYTDGIWMIGSMNTRHNTSPTDYPMEMRITSSPSGPIYFSGQSSSGTYFWCYVRPEDSLYAAATEIKNTVRSGSQIQVIKNSASDSCRLLYHGISSGYVD